MRLIQRTSRAENQTDGKQMQQKILQEFQDFDNEGFDVTKCLFDVVQNSKLRLMMSREIFLFGLEFTDQPSVANWLGRSFLIREKLPKSKLILQHHPIGTTEPETKLVVVLLLLPALQPTLISNSLLTKEERSWVEVAESPTLNLRI